jgi:poly(A) polymerase
MVDSESPNGSSLQMAAKYGITKPISLAGPTEADLQRSMELEKVKIRSDFFSFCWLGLNRFIANFLI